MTFYGSTVSRRTMLMLPFGFAAGSSVWAADRPRIAAIMHVWFPRSHADVIFSRLFDGYDYEGQHRSPRMNIVSMHVEQFPTNDMSRAAAQSHGVPMYSTIREALCCGGDDLAVDGVVYVGEHGNYPENGFEQKLYPRYELFMQITDVFRQVKRTVPVFTDKHLSYDFSFARRMYDDSVKLGFPLMAGSSLPLTWRRPVLEIPWGIRLEKAVTTSYGDIDAYGFHSLETLQCMVERREGGETGVRRVRGIKGQDVWRWTDEHPWADKLLAEALARCTRRTGNSPRTATKNPCLFHLEYLDGLEAAVYHLDGYVSQFAFAAQPAGSAPVSSLFELQGLMHFSVFSHFIEEMMLTGKPSYPVERTLLTSTMLSLVLVSAFTGCPIERPELGIAYAAPRESFFMRGPVPPYDTPGGTQKR